MHGPVSVVGAVAARLLHARVRRLQMRSWIAFLALVGCGHSSGNMPDPAEFGRVASAISAAAGAHRAAIAAAATIADCQAERDRYGADVTPLLDEMQGMSGDIDSCMTNMGHTNATSMRATCASMHDEYDRHMRAACASSQMPDNASKATTHADRMMGWASTASNEAGDMRNMMGGAGMMGGSGMMNACQMR